MTQMAILNARILDPASSTDETGGLIVADGVIVDFGPHIKSAPDGAEAIDANGLCLAPGLVDLRVKTGEPGEEHRETLASASRAAVAGGVTSMVVMPDTNPVIDDVAVVEFITRRAADTALNRIYPAGALTNGLEGSAMAEIGLMQESGAVFFTNGDQALADASTMRRAMTYAASRDAVVASRPAELSLSGGMMNSGAFAARMGLSGLPADAEWIALARDLTLAETTGCALIVDLISTGRSLEMVSQARQRGARVGVTAAAYSFFFNELDVGDYLTYCKVQPPFRSEDERQALIAGLKSGEIDAVVSAHDPQPPEAKRVPYAEAAFGAAGLETTLAAMLALFHDGRLSLLEALKPLTSGPADLIDLPQGRLAAGAPADFMLFDPGAPWLCQREDLRSRSTNSPFDGRRLEGLVMQTWVGGKSVFKR
ncbi:MAG: amidohydrolase family protein [Pseudomonadota bacterium]